MLRNLEDVVRVTVCCLHVEARTLVWPTPISWLAIIQCVETGGV